MPWNFGNARWWESMFERNGAIWVHDKNVHRPYALLTHRNPTNNKRRLSNVYFDGSKIVEQPSLLYRAARDLLNQLPKDALEKVDIVCGSPFGSIALACLVGLALSDHTVRSRAHPECLAWFTEPTPDSSAGQEKELSLNRFGPAKAGSQALVVDDALTSGRTSEKTARALEGAGAQVLPYYLYLVNRTGVQNVGDKRILSLYTFPEGLVKSWDEGQNPFTPGGEELVEPVSPKQQWDALTHAYP